MVKTYEAINQSRYGQILWNH